MAKSFTNHQFDALNVFMIIFGDISCFDSFFCFYQTYQTKILMKGANVTKAL